MRHVAQLHQMRCSNRQLSANCPGPSAVPGEFSVKSIPCLRSQHASAVKFPALPLAHVCVVRLRYLLPLTLQAAFIESAALLRASNQRQSAPSVHKIFHECTIVRVAVDQQQFAETVSQTCAKLPFILLAIVMQQRSCALHEARFELTNIRRLALRRKRAAAVFQSARPLAIVTHAAVS